MIKAFVILGTAILGMLQPLDHLYMYNKDIAVENLESADLPNLWDHLLKGQADLFFSWDSKWLAEEHWWNDAEKVLELGSGNGIYLAKLAERFPEKTYLGIEKKPELVLKSPQTFKLSFEAGDAELENAALAGQFDVILYRLTLQHLSQPKKALEIARSYLKPNGHIIIIDACDLAKRSSHTIPTLEEANRQHNERNQKEGKGNRRITMELLSELESAENPAFEVVWSNLNAQGQALAKRVSFTSPQERQGYFNNMLLYLAILKKQWNIDIDFKQAYNELHVSLDDETFWAEPGMHYLVLKKKVILSEDGKI